MTVYSLLLKQMFLQACPGCPGRPVPDAGTCALSWALLTSQREHSVSCWDLHLSDRRSQPAGLLWAEAIHLLSQFFINALGFTAPCWIKCKVCSSQLLAHSLLQQHWDGLFQLSASSCHSNSLWFNYTQPNFSPQLLSSHKIGLPPKSLPRNLGTWKERDISRNDKSGRYRRGKEPSSRVKTIFFSLFVVI